MSSAQLKSSEPLPFPEREVPRRWSSDRQQARDSGFLLLMVLGYLLALGGGIVLLGVLTPVSHSTLVATSDTRSH